MKNTNDEPGSGILGWLGRQVGHVRKAFNASFEANTIYRSKTVDELPHPADPNVTLRRTTIDEAVAKKSRAPRE